jgi:hypothetical protein
MEWEKTVEPTKKKTIVVRAQVEVEDYKNAKELCKLTHEEIVEMIAEDGTCGLSNYVANTDNWIS